MTRRVRRVSITAEVAGESTEYWEHEWASIDLRRDLERQLRAPDPTLRLLRRLVPSSGVVLEAGSGASTYLAALRSDDRTMVGVDLAGRALRASAAQWPDVAFVDGDVRQLPFRDRSIDCVVSLGVVEHIEEGPHDALVEHRRILRPGGIGIVSVPVISGVKWMKDRWHLDLRRRESYVARRRSVTTVEGPRRIAGADGFHQYEFSVADWDRQLRDAGFEVVEHHRYMVSAGIGEITVPRLGRGAPVEAPSTAGDRAPEGASATAPAPRRGDAARRVLIGELADGPLERAARRASQRLLGHMVMSVVRPR